MYVSADAYPAGICIAFPQLEFLSLLDFLFTAWTASFAVICLPWCLFASPLLLFMPSGWKIGSSNYWRIGKEMAILYHFVTAWKQGLLAWLYICYWDIRSKSSVWASEVVTSIENLLLYDLPRLPTGEFWRSPSGGLVESVVFTLQRTRSRFYSTYIKL